MSVDFSSFFPNVCNSTSSSSSSTAAKSDHSRYPLTLLTPTASTSPLAHAPPFSVESIINGLTQGMEVSEVESPSPVDPLPPTSPLPASSGASATTTREAQGSDAALWPGTTKNPDVSIVFACSFALLICWLRHALGLRYAGLVASSFTQAFMGKCIIGCLKLTWFCPTVRR